MLKKLDQAFSKVEGFLSVVLFLAMVAIVCWSVICRYALKIPFLQSEELARYLMIYIVYIGTSIGVKSKSHIGVEVFVDMLPEIYAGVIRLRYFYDMDVEEIANILGISVDNVYQRLTRARKIIKNKMGDEFYEQNVNG